MVYVSYVIEKMTQSLDIPATQLAGSVLLKILKIFEILRVRPNRIFCASFLIFSVFTKKEIKFSL